MKYTSMQGVQVAPLSHPQWVWRTLPQYWGKMGFIIDTDDEELGLEKRKESFYIYALKGEHIFLYPEKDSRTGTAEMSKVFLRKLVDYFKKHPEELKGE